MVDTDPIVFNINMVVDIRWIRNDINLLSIVSSLIPFSYINVYYLKFLNSKYPNKNKITYNISVSDYKDRIK